MYSNFCSSYERLSTASKNYVWVHPTGRVFRHIPFLSHLHPVCYNSVTLFFVVLLRNFLPQSEGLMHNLLKSVIFSRLLLPSLSACTHTKSFGNSPTSPNSSPSEISTTSRIASSSRLTEAEVWYDVSERSAATRRSCRCCICNLTIGITLLRKIFK